MNTLKKLLRSTLFGLLDGLTARLSNTGYLKWLVDNIAARARRLPPDEALRLLFDLDAELYHLQGEQSIRYDGGIHTKHRHMRYHDFFIERVNADDHVLDIGCGIGAVAYKIADQKGAQVLGVDFSEEHLAIARERFAHPQVRYVYGDVLKDLPDGQYDVVIMSNVLEHLPGRAEFLRGVQQAADPARLLIRVPVFERDWRVPLKRELGVEWRLDHTHETEYTLESFAEEMTDAGLTITHLEVRWGEIWAEVAPDAAAR